MTATPDNSAIGDDAPHREPSLGARTDAHDEGPAKSQTLRAWLGSRQPAPPPQLADRLMEIAGTKALDSPASANILLEKGIATLRSALSDRDGALDLLAADALITYAMEAAADDCATMDVAAAEAIQRIARGTE